MLLFTTSIYANEVETSVDEEVTNEVETSVDEEVTDEAETSVDEEVTDEAETSVDEEVDLEVLDRIREYEMRHVGTKEMSQELIASVTNGLAQDNMPIDIVVNNQYLQTDVDALIINNRTYVPFRAVVEAFNFTDVIWNEDLYKTSFKIEDTEIELLINTNEVIVNGEELLMDTPSIIIDGRTMVPIRFISEYLGFQVSWDPVYYIVELKHDTYEVNEEKLGTRFYSVDELKTFSKLIYKEAGSVSYETKHGVASVVMNQVRSEALENTLNGVIYDESRLEHFPPAHESDFLETVPNKDSVLAAKKTVRGENSVGDCIYFNTSPFQGKTIYKVVDGVYFCY